MPASPSTELQDRARRERAKRERYRRDVMRDFARFVREAHRSRSSKVLLWAAHLDGFCELAQAMAEEWLLLHGCLHGEHERQARARIEAAWRLHGLEKADHEGELLVQNVTINAPPGSLKSEIIMVYLPAWCWLHATWLRFGCASGIPKNVTRDSDAMRDLVSGEWYREAFRIKWEIRGDINAKGKWANTAGGERQSVTMGEGFTGQHVHWLLLDDPDDPDHVWSDAAREHTRDRWTRVFENRVDEETTALRFIVQQQVHPEDLTNYVRSVSLWSSSNRMGWAWLCVALIKGREPQTYPGVTPFGWRDARAANENMQAERYPERVLEDKRRKLGTAGFEAQYNQNAAIENGGWFKREYFRFFALGDRPSIVQRRPQGCTAAAAIRIDPDADGRYPFERVYLTIDASMGSTEESASGCGLVVVGVRGNGRYVLDDRTAVMDSLQLEKTILGIIGTWHLTDLLIELKALGQSLVTKLTAALRDGLPMADGSFVPVLGPDGAPALITVTAYKPPAKDSKASRARAALPGYEAALWHLLDGAAWIDDHVGEVSRFPQPGRNDRVDCCSQLDAHLASQPGSAPIIFGGFLITADDDRDPEM